MEKFYLSVPYSEKDEAKSKGARWDPEKKKWYVPGGYPSIFLIKWIQELKENPHYSVFNEYYYIGENKRLCWKCGEQIKLYAICLPPGHKYLCTDMFGDYPPPVTKPDEWQIFDGCHYSYDSDGILNAWTSLYIDLCNCLILICSIQHQKQVNLWTKNSYRPWLTNWPKISKPLTISTSSIAC